MGHGSRPATRGRAVRWAFAALPALGLLGGCNLFKFSLTKTVQEPPLPAAPAQPTPPGKFSQRASQFLFLSDFELQADQPLFRELTELREQVVRELQLPTPTTLIQVYLFEDREHYERFMRSRYPDLPARRAFFVAQPTGVGGADELMVYTFKGDFVRQDLRHELTHAMLHSVLKDVPLWLDEGLAEFYELPPEADGLNLKHLTDLRQIAYRTDLARLEKLGQVSQMNQSEYREAWAWVHLMLRGDPKGKAVLLGYLKLMRTTSSPGQLQPLLKPVYADPSKALADHLAGL